MSEQAPTVVISTGFNKTHMTTAAREVFERSQLVLAITGMYPTPRLSRVLRATGLGSRWRIPRLLERDERIPAERLKTLALPELVCGGVRALLDSVPGARGVSERLCVAMWRLYGWRARRQLDRLSPPPDVYHYRAGYGQASLQRARERGIRIVCDQALAHPATLGELVARRGRLSASLAVNRDRMSAIDRAVLNDIDHSDAVIVNSDFVKETFLACGWAEERVHVVYLGVDDNFLGSVRHCDRRPLGGPLRLLFAGRFERRKGADEVVEALARLNHEPWQLVIAGPIVPEMRAETAAFLDDPRVKALGSLPRDRVAQEMLRAEVLLLPSYAEGSARVVFEALACGCYVITTPNSGTIVEDGVHGALIPPGDAQILADAIAAAGADRGRVAEIGDRNAALVHMRHRQSEYGKHLGAVYAELTSEERMTSVSI